MPLVLCMMGRKAHPHDRRASYFNHKGGESSSKSNEKKNKFDRLDETNQFSIVENVELSQATLTRISMTAKDLSSTASNDPIQPSSIGTAWKWPKFLNLQQHYPTARNMANPRSLGVFMPLWVPRSNVYYSTLWFEIKTSNFH